VAYPPRFNYPGAVYHVTDLGTGGCAIFRDTEDHERYNWTLGVNVDRYGWLVLMWVHMTTHVHILLQTPLGNLTPGMQRLKSVYAQGYNQKYKRKGALFAERYSCWFIQSDTHFFRTVRYIARNPFEEGMCARPEDFRWSSYGPTLRGDTPRPANGAAELVRRCGGDEALKRLVDFGFEAETG
jgi:putative transposase